MLLGITNTPRDYAWGSTTAIADLLGTTASGGPEAELWLGAHPGSPSRLTAPAAGDPATLDGWIAAHPGSVGAGRTALPFLMKVLAAERPLSLQVHPDPEQARAGFERENAAGIPIDDPARNYRDASAKPELILALSPTFEAIAGFRGVGESRLLLAELAGAGDRQAIAALDARLADPDESAALEDAVGWLLGGGEDALRTVDAIVDAAGRMGERSSFAREWATVATLAADHPHDPGIAISLLMNRVSLAQGQALALQAGEPHAYLEGLGIEVMTSSDNVLRGGLTSKHVDVPELLSVLRFQPAASPIVVPDSPAPGLQVYRTSGEDFVLVSVATGDAGAVHGYRLAGPESVSFELNGPAILLVLAGGAQISGRQDAIALGRGDAAFATADEGALTIAGSASVVVATTP